MIAVNQKEVYRYMGFGQGVCPQPEIVHRVEKCEDRLQNASHPKYVCHKYPLTVHPDGALEIAGMQWKSRALAKNLRGCQEVYLFGATLGIGADRLIARAQVTRMSDAVIYQAAAAAMIESYCDRINAQIREKEAETGHFLRPRFSPGYGDLPLSAQTDVMRILNTPKTIGLTLTDTLLMMPSKSVTALIGVSDQPGRCRTSGCTECSKTDCEYRKKTESGENPSEKQTAAS